MEMRAHAPPLHAALDYCARKLLTELERTSDARGDTTLARRLTPTTAALLRWWCSAGRCNTRVENFHPGQRQAILHTVIAHELLQTDDPDWLYRLACDPLCAWDEAPIAAADTPRYAGHVLRLAPGTGLRWVTQALLVWQWANDVDARALGREDARFSGNFALLAANGAVWQRLQDALFGPADAAGRRSAAKSSPIRHARLFLPPPLLAPFRDWLDRQSTCADGDSALHIAEAAGETDETCPTAPPITFIAGVGARMLSGGRCIHAAAGDGSEHHGQPAQASLLWIDLAFAQGPTAAGIASTPIVEYPLERAIRDGAAKLPMLESTQQLKLPPLRTKPPRHMGLRPQLSRAHRGLLDVALTALEQRDAGFTALEPTRRPKLLVLCDTPSLVRGVRWWLRACGMAAGDIDARVAIDALSAPTVSGDARICVIVMLRTCVGPRPGIGANPSVAALGPGLPPLWPESDFAPLRSDSRERAALGRPPGHLLDALSVVEHPQCHGEYADLLRAGLAAHAGENRIADVIGDLTVAGLRADADAYEIALPHRMDSQAVDAERLGDLPHRILRARQSMPVRKCVYTHAGWSAHDSGLGRAFLECAEHDPAIESHCLLDPRRHAVRTRDDVLAKGASPLGWPDALVRTADAVYLVAFLPSCPAQEPPPGQTPGSSERALTRWCADANALPPEQRQHRRWHRVHVQAPLFWSWKRSQGTLSALLAALAGTAPLMRRDRTTQAAD